MIQLSIVLAFIIGGLISPGGKILKLFFSFPTLKAMSLLEQSSLAITVHYLIPASLIYLTFRLLKIDTKLKFQTSVSSLFSIAIFIYLSYFGLRLFASTIPGGGASFAVRSLSPYIIFPAWGLMLIGIIKLLIDSAKMPKGTKKYFPLSFHEIFTLSIPFVFTALLISSMFIRPNGPLRLAFNEQKIFDEKCVMAKEEIFHIPQNLIGVYTDETGGARFEKIDNNNIYRSYGSGMWGNRLYRDGTIPFVETKNYRNDNNEYRYLYYDADNPRGIKTNKLKSNYGVYWQRSNVPNSSIQETIITVTNLENDEQVATTTYYTSKQLFKVCGNIVDKNLRDSDFIKRVFSKSNQTHVMQN